MIHCTRIHWRIGDWRGTPVQRAMRRTLDVIGRLESAGCQVLAASAIGRDGPLVRIAPPPAGMFSTYGYRQPPPLSVPVPVRCVALRDGVRIEWTERRGKA